MIAAAEIGIGFGGVRDIAPAVLKSATHAAYSEDKLCQFLNNCYKLCRNGNKTWYRNNQGTDRY